MAIPIPPQAIAALAAMLPQLLKGNERPPVQPGQMPQYTPVQIEPPNVTPPNFSEPLPELKPVPIPRPNTMPMYAEGTGPGIGGAFAGPMPEGSKGFFGDAKAALPEVASAVGQQYLSDMEERRNRLRQLAASGPGIQQYQPGFSPFRPGGVHFTGLLGGRNG